MAGKRYGRRRKRQHREQIAVLTAQVKALMQANEMLRADYQLASIRAARAVEAAHHAEAQAFRQFMAASGFLKIVAEKMASAMGQKLGEELRPVAERILARNQKMPPMFSASRDPIQNFTRIHGRIPQIDYAYVVKDEQMQEFGA